jgi:hypothetical protein
MLEVREIFRWYRDFPKIPQNFTTIQREQWKNEHATLFNKSFVGQKVSMCPAKIVDISHDKIKAQADYHLDYSIDLNGRHVFHQKNKSHRHYALISYEVIYNNSEFYTLVKSIHIEEMVEIEGIIKNVSLRGSNDSEYFDYCLSIQLSLTSLCKIEARFLHAELLDEKLRYQPDFRERFCFIATACYGNYDAPEVLILRQFRDKKLLTTFLGKVLIKFYYSVSPLFARLISKSGLLKKIVRQCFLDPIVNKLRQQNYNVD